MSGEIRVRGFLSEGLGQHKVAIGQFNSKQDAIDFIEKNNEIELETTEFDPTLLPDAMWVGLVRKK
ncbi:MAG: hypothetical protein HWN65_22820 [Candidatus Helarchaeota archaeon]|nr:hypothetical protein [Candidatus Helarchaeota archaeon]